MGDDASQDDASQPAGFDSEYRAELGGLAAVLHPIPQPGPGEDHHDGFLAMRDEAAEEQARTAQVLQDGWSYGEQTR